MERTLFALHASLVERDGERERERVWIWNRFEDCNMSNILTSLHISFCCHTNSLLDLIRFKEENFV